MKIGMRAGFICLMLSSSAVGPAFAQQITTQPSPPFANSPFVAFVQFDDPFDSHAGFDPASLNVQGNTVSVEFYTCFTTCSFTPSNGPFSLQLPALRAGDYTLEVLLVGFSPNPPPLLLPFTVSATAAPSPLPIMSSSAMCFLLGGIILVASLSMRRAATTDRKFHG